MSRLLPSPKAVCGAIQSCPAAETGASPWPIGRGSLWQRDGGGGELGLQRGVPCQVGGRAYFVGRGKGCGACLAPLQGWDLAQKQPLNQDPAGASGAIPSRLCRAGVPIAFNPGVGSALPLSAALARWRGQRHRPAAWDRKGCPAQLVDPRWLSPAKLASSGSRSKGKVATRVPPAIPSRGRVKALPQ